MADSNGTDTAIAFIILLLILAAIGAAAGDSMTAAPVDDDPAVHPARHASPFPEPPEDVCPDGCEGY
jgi:hypothetical protein